MNDVYRLVRHTKRSEDAMEQMYMVFQKNTEDHIEWEQASVPLVKEKVIEFKKIVEKTYPTRHYCILTELTDA